MNVFPFSQPSLSDFCVLKYIFLHLASAKNIIYTVMCKSIILGSYLPLFVWMLEFISLSFVVTKRDPQNPVPAQIDPPVLNAKYANQFKIT